MPVCATPTEPEPRVVAARDRVGDERAVHRGDRHRRLALAVDLREPRAQRGERRLAVGDVHRPAAVDDRSSAARARAARSPAYSTRRLTIVGAAKNSAPVPRAERARRSRPGSKPPDSGTTLTAPRARRAARRRGPSRATAAPDAGSRRRARSASTSARKHCVIATRLRVRDHDALRPPGRAARVEEPRRSRVATRPAPGRPSRCPRAPRARDRRARTRTLERRDARSPPSVACQPASTNAQRAPLSSSTNASSFGCSFAFTGTATRPAHQQANSASRYAGSLRATSATRSPGARPAARMPAACRADAPGERRVVVQRRRPRAPPPATAATRVRRAPATRPR